MAKTKNQMKTCFKRIKSWLRGEQDLEKLVSRGLKIGKNFTRMGGVIIDPSHCWHITIGDNVTLAPNVHLLAHDASTKVFLNHTRVANTKIGSNVFVGAGTIVLPGVRIGNNVIIGAGSVVSRSIPDNAVAMGCPAKVVKSIDEYLAKERQLMNSENVFDENYTLRNEHFGSVERQAMIDACEKYGQVFVE